MVYCKPFSLTRHRLGINSWDGSPRRRRGSSSLFDLSRKLRDRVPDVGPGAVIRDDAAVAQHGFESGAGEGALLVLDELQDPEARPLHGGLRLLLPGRRIVEGRRVGPGPVPVQVSYGKRYLPQWRAVKELTAKLLAAFSQAD
jgi:hypothetical protein